MTIPPNSILDLPDGQLELHYEDGHVKLYVWQKDACGHDQAPIHLSADGARRVIGWMQEQMKNIADVDTEHESANKDVLGVLRSPRFGSTLYDTWSTGTPTTYDGDTWRFHGLAVNISESDASRYSISLEELRRKMEGK